MGKEEKKHKRVTFCDDVEVIQIYQSEKENCISKRDFNFAKCKLKYFLELKIKSKVVNTNHLY